MPGVLVIPIDLNVIQFETNGFINDVLPHKLRWAVTTVRLSCNTLLVCFPSISTT